MAHIENMQMKYSNNIKLVIVSPCFNEEQLLKQSSDILNGVLEDLITKIRFQMIALFFMLMMVV